jgi:hypothetical protein
VHLNLFLASELQLEQSWTCSSIRRGFCACLRFVGVSLLSVTLTYFCARGSCNGCYGANWPHTPHMIGGKLSKQPPADYLRNVRLYSGSVPKPHQQWLGRAIKLALATVSAEFLNGNGKQGRGLRCRAEARTPDRYLKRRRGRQGSGYKCPQIREQLRDWFVDIRRSVSTTLSAKFVLQRARCFGHVLLEEMRRTGRYQPLPKLDYD